MEGWLVKPRQAFASCSLDFSTLKVRRTKDGDKDFSDRDIKALLLDQDEAEWRTLAKGIHSICKDEPAIVICPNSVEVAKLVAYHLDGEADSEVAQPIYGAQGKEGNDLIEAYKRGEFQYAVSVNKLYKGFDADRVRFVCMLRKTRSRRLYEQSAGRGTRPLVEIRQALQDAPDADARRAIIEASAKPYATMVDLVGIHPDAKDLGVIDILGDYLPENLRERTKAELQKQAGESQDVGAVARKCNEEIKAEAEERRAIEAAERRRRSLVQVDGEVTVQYTDDMGMAGPGNHAPVKRGNASTKMVRLLIAKGCDPKRAAAMSRRQAGLVLNKMKDKEPTKDGWIRAKRWMHENGETL